MIGLSKYIEQFDHSIDEWESQWLGKSETLTEAMLVQIKIELMRNRQEMMAIRNEIRCMSFTITLILIAIMYFIL